MASVAEKPQFSKTSGKEMSWKNHNVDTTEIITISDNDEDDEDTIVVNADPQRKVESAKEKDNQEFDTNWDIDNYKTEYESEEHWELRRRFMEAHKDKFPEERLVCLAQTFVNMEFMGCRYPAEAMRLVGELSQEVAKQFRKDRATRLKRTFVSAADAAEQRAKGRRGGAATNSRTEQSHTGVRPNQRQQLGYGNQMQLFDGCRFGKLVLYLNGGRNCLRQSAMASKVKYDEREVVSQSEIKCAEVIIDGVVVATGNGDSIKSAKLVAYKTALQLLQNHCYSIKLNPKREIIKIEKANNQVVLNIANEAADSNVADNKLDEKNKGFRMMRMMGWSGGGLGSQKQGREDPVGYLLKNNRLGLGAASQLDTANFTKMIKNYVDSDDLRDLQFEPTFTKEERASLHSIASKFYLRSVSYGTGEERRLIITKKITNEEILQEVLVERNPKYCARFFVQVPESKSQQFPAHNELLELDSWDR